MPFKREDDRVIRRAIAEKRMIRFVMDGKARIAEPHDYGIRNDIPTLLVWQTSGASRSGKLPDWRWIHLAKASDFQLLDANFSGGRGGAAREHSQWEVLWARVDPPDES